MQNARVNNLDAFWMPYSANRQFHKAPRMFVAADKMHYKTDDGRQVLDATAGLWCVNAGHKRPKIVEAIKNQVEELDYAPAFQMGHPKVFELAARLARLSPNGLDHVFFTNSGSEGVETALKIALAYHKAKGDGGRFRLIGRERGYHGTNFGGVSVGGIVANRKMFGTLLTGVDHMRDTHDLERNAFTKGQPEHGEEYADDLLRIAKLHDPSTIAAVIVEPLAGSTGVLLPPKGYLQRLRKHCDDHGILLIFDEVITGYGRIGAPFGSQYFGVTPDLMVTAKGLTNGIIPMGATFASSEIYNAFMTGPEHLIELFHGYTYSGNPMSCAAALATLDTYEEEGLYTRAAELSDYWEQGLHSLKDHPNVIDVRNLGLIGAIELAPIASEPTKRGFSAFLEAYDKNLLIRTTGDIIALSPPLIISKSEIDFIFETLGSVLKSIN